MELLNSLVDSLTEGGSVIICDIPNTKPLAQVLDYWSICNDPSFLLSNEGSATGNDDHELLKDEDFQDLGQDVDVLLSGLVDPVSRLYRLSVWIRNPSTRQMPSKALTYQMIDPESNIDLFHVIEDFDRDYVRSMLLEFRKSSSLDSGEPNPPSINPEETKEDRVWEPIRTVLEQHDDGISAGNETFLAERVSRAIAQRRRLFAYWKKHRDKLGRHAASVVERKKRPETQEHLELGDQVPTFESSVSKAPTAQTVTTATFLDPLRFAPRDDQSQVSVSEYAPSVAKQSPGKIEFPPAPSLPDVEKFFECPYCFVMCPVALLRPSAWK